LEEVVILVRMPLNLLTQKKITNNQVRYLHGIR